MSNIAEALWCPDDDLQMMLAKRIGETLIVSPDVCDVCGTGRWVRVLKRRHHDAALHRCEAGVLLDHRDQKLLLTRQRCLRVHRGLGHGIPKFSVWASRLATHTAVVVK